MMPGSNEVGEEEDVCEVTCDSDKEFEIGVSPA